MTEDLAEYDVVLSEESVNDLRERPKLGIAAQTTQPIDRVRYLVGLICIRFPNAQIRFIDTVCQPTKQRQEAAVDLAKQCDLVLVIGGAHSNNTRELVNTCRQFCGRVEHIQSASDIREDWFECVKKVGLTAGTSTPDSVIEAVEARLRDIAAYAPASGWAIW